MGEKIGNKIQPITPEIRKAFKIFQWELRHDTKQNYGKAFKKANTRKVYKRYKSEVKR